MCALRLARICLDLHLDHLLCIDRLTPQLGELVAKLWAHESVQKLFKRRSEFQLNDSAEFYFQQVARLSAEGYVPTTDDVLRSRVRTTGIVQSDFKIKGLDFSMCVP